MNTLKMLHDLCCFQIPFPLKTEQKRGEIAKGRIQASKKSYFAQSVFRPVPDQHSLAVSLLYSPARLLPFPSAHTRSFVRHLFSCFVTKR